jgi:hypothetical protein
MRKQPNSTPGKRNVFVAQNPNAPTPRRDPLHDPPGDPTMSRRSRWHRPDSGWFHLLADASRNCRRNVASARNSAGRSRYFPPAGLCGCAGATLLDHGFRIAVLADLVCDGLATGHRETMRVVRITDAGRNAIEGN